MPKGYWLPQIDVSDMEGYKAYMEATPPAHEKYKGVALVRGGSSEVVEGRVRSRCVIREFPDYATALACYRSDEYQRARVCACRIRNAILSLPRVLTIRSRLIGGAAGVKKGYWIVHLDVTDAEAYALSARAARASRQIRHTLSGARRRPRSAGGQGSRPHRRRGIPELRPAMTCYRSAEYVPVKKLRQGNADVDW